MAVSGTKYEIAVEGNIFNPNPGVTPDTEGEFERWVEWTPPPPNDDFADPKVIKSEIEEEPDGRSGPEVVSVYQGTSLTGLDPTVRGGAPLFGYAVQVGVGLQDRRRRFLQDEEAPVVAQPPLSPPPADTTPPQTTIGKRSVKPRQGEAELRFASAEAGSSFRCTLDSKPFRTCQSPARFANLASGQHVLRVVAVDADPSPAVARFGIDRSAAG